MTALVPTAAQRCENCHTPLIPYGAQMCWACGGPSVRVDPARSGRAVEAISLGGAIGGSFAYWIYDTNVALMLGLAIGAAVFGLGAGVIHLFRRRGLPPGPPVLALPDSSYRTQLDAVERDVVAFLITVDAGLRANADAVAARGSSSPALDSARQTLEDVRARYEAHLADTLVASELATVASWLRRMSQLASLPITDAEQARAVMARFDQDLAAARSPSYAKRARLEPGATPALVLLVRETYPALAIRSELAATLPPRFADAWTRAIDSAAPLRTTVADQLELAAVRAAANVAGQVHLIDNPDRPTLALTATASVVGSLESEVARLLEESERIRAESDAMREVEATLSPM